MKNDILLARVDELLTLGESAKIKDSAVLRMEVSTFIQYRSESLVFIESVCGRDHPLYKDFVKRSDFDYYDNLIESLAILRAVKSIILGGWLKSQRGLITAAIFEDIFEMAEHLLEEGYKDAAAVMVGTLLEQHIKEVCKNHSIEINREQDYKLIHKKTELLNSELCKANVYSSSDQKQVTAWLGLRNDAAHGNYDEYESQQVKIMLEGVRNFTTRIS